MTKVMYFAAGLASAKKGKKEIKNHCGTSFPDQTLLESQSNHKIHDVKLGKNTIDQRRFHAKKNAKTANSVAAIAAAIEADHLLMMLAIAQANSTSEKTIYRILTEDLGLITKSSWLVPKLLTSKKKDERVQTRQAMKKLVFKMGESVLGKIITEVQQSVFFHTQAIKNSVHAEAEERVNWACKSRGLCNLR